MNRRAFVLGSAGLGGAAWLRAAEGSGPLPFRFGMSEYLIAKNVTMAETKQAMTTWAQEIKRQIPNFLDFQIAILSSPDIQAKIQRGELDGAVVSAFEYPSVAALSDSTVMVNEAAPAGEEYLLLVRQDAGIKSIADLRGRKMATYDHPRMKLADYWLESLLANDKLPPAEAFFSSRTVSPKLNLSVLAVFFKTADVCLVARRSFATMVELNPQLGVKLQILASSPKLVTSVLLFRKDCPRQIRTTFEQALGALKKAPAGQQAFALFDGTGVVTANVSILKPSLELIAAHDHLRARSGAGGK